MRSSWSKGVLRGPLREPNSLAVLEALGNGPYWGAGYALLRADTGLSGNELDWCLEALEGAGLVEVRRGELLGMRTAHAELTEAGRAAGRRALGALPGSQGPDLREKSRREEEGQGVPVGRPRAAELGVSGVGSDGLVVDPVGDSRKLARTKSASKEHELRGEIS